MPFRGAVTGSVNRFPAGHAGGIQADQACRGYKMCHVCYGWGRQTNGKQG